jgi:hypothetical protein
MKIYIPSRGRPHNQKTAELLVAAGVNFKIVVAANDPTLPDYRAEWGSRVIVIQAKTLCEKRAKLFEKCRAGRMVMLDDDLTFFDRKRDGSFKKSSSKEVMRMLVTMNHVLSAYAHAGLIDKFMSQHQPRGVKVDGRYNQVLGYNIKMIKARARKLKVPVPNFRMPLNQEHDMHLQLLSIGLPAGVLCEYSKDAKYYAVGGLKKFRTVAVERAAFKRLAKAWPQYVTLRETKHSISGIGATFKWRNALDNARLVNAQATGIL